jgi:phosphate transport system substrate-binding protein
MDVLESTMLPRCAVAILLLLGCAPERTETPVSGELRLLVGESIAPSVAELVQQFSALYGSHGAVVTYEVMSSDDAIRRFLHDTIRCIVVARQLTPEEHDIVRRRAGSLIELRVAYDAVAAVVHYRNPVERITTPQLTAILDGTLKRWEELARSYRGGIRLVLEDSSDMTAFLQRRLLGEKDIRANFQRTRSSLETLRRVVEDPLSIGFVGVDWIDSARVPAKALEVAQTEADVDTVFRPFIETVGKFYSPHPAHIYRNYYPMKRAIYLYTTSVRGDLASGFGTFVVHRDGQQVFLRRGLVPATQPIRLKVGE